MARARSEPTPAEIVFTASGTEADNMALRGAAARRADAPRRKIVYSAVEHHAVLNTAKALRRGGLAGRDRRASGEDGAVDLDDLRGEGRRHDARSSR